MRIGCAARAQDAGVIASCGYDYLELPGRWAAAQPPSQLRALARHLEALGLPCEGFNAYCPPEVVIVGEGLPKPRNTPGAAPGRGRSWGSASWESAARFPGRLRPAMTKKPLFLKCQISSTRRPKSFEPME